MKTLKTTMFILSLMVSSVAFSQVYDDFEISSDGSIDRDAFNQVYMNNYSSWDIDGDGSLNDRDFYEATYNRLDEDGDGYLTENDWNNGYDNMYGDFLGTPDYSQFDMDGDGRISNEEYYTGFENSDFYSSYDINNDGNIDRNELSEGVFNNWDANMDGSIDKNEYDAYSGYYIDR